MRANLVIVIIIVVVIVVVSRGLRLLGGGCRRRGDRLGRLAGDLHAGAGTREAVRQTGMTKPAASVMACNTTSSTGMFTIYSIRARCRGALPMVLPILLSLSTGQILVASMRTWRQGAP